MQRRRMLLEVREEAAEFTQGLKRDVDPAEAVQLILDNMTTAYEYCVQQMMALDEEDYWQPALGGPVLHPWIREQERLGLQIIHAASKAVSMGLAERQVKLQEQQAAIFATVVEAVMVELGLSSEVRHQAHALIATRLEDIEGTATERTPDQLPVEARAA